MKYNRCFIYIIRNADSEREVGRVLGLRRDEDRLVDVVASKMIDGAWRKLPENWPLRHSEHSESGIEISLEEGAMILFEVSS